MNVVATMYSGQAGQELKAITLARHQRYAAKCGAEFKVVEPIPGLTFAEMMLFKMQATVALLNRWERVLWIDGDILIHRNSPNLFDIVPADHFAAVDENAVANDDEVRMRQEHVLKTCNEEGLQVPTTDRYFNCGMYLAGSSHRDLFAPRLSVSDDTWCEQTLVNIRLALADIKVTTLPECFNRLVYWGQKPRRHEDASYFLHYAGPPSPEQRVDDMARQAESWGAY